MMIQVIYRIDYKKLWILEISLKIFDCIMTFFQDISEDLAQATPDETIDTNPPYTEDMTNDLKFEHLYRALLRAKRLHHRTLQLLNAYHIGKFLEKELAVKERPKYTKKLTYHYQNICSRTYFLFEFLGPKVIFSMKKTTLTMIRKLTTQEHQDLVCMALIFSGAENLGGE